MDVDANPADDREPRGVNWRLGMLAMLGLAGVAVIALTLIVQGQLDRARDEALAWQRHSYDVLLRTGQVETEVARAEASLARYVVAGEATPGQQFSSHWTNARSHLARLRQLTADNPTQVARIAALSQALDARGAELSRTALYIPEKRYRDGLGSFYAMSQTKARAAVEKGLDAIADAERQLLRDRTANAAALIGRSSMAVTVLTIFGILIVLAALLLGWYAIEARAERMVADADARAERLRAAELAEAVAAATSRLRAEAMEREEAEARLRQLQKIEAVGQLTGGIAHDFNNMLAVVIGGIELAKRHLPAKNSEARRHVESAMEGANRAAALTRRLLAFARAETLMPEAVDPGAVIAGMSDLLDRTLGDAVAVATLDISSGWLVWIDRHQLENALLNLAVNARDAMNGRGTLTIKSETTVLAQAQIGDCDAGEYVRISVSDTGSGMTPEVLERAFEPFFTTKPVGQGTGLGLSQIFGFVRQSGGCIAIDTAPGMGTTVHLYLPRHLGALEPAAPVGVEDPATPREGLDILLVEDDPRVLAAAAEALRELGHRPVPCGDPLAAPEAIAGMPSLDLIVSDVLMPGQSGPEMIAALGDRIAGTPVLYVTGYAGETDPEAFGGHPVLRKPFTIAALGRAVEAAIVGQRQAAQLSG